jgi:hypothetical protein
MDGLRKKMAAACPEVGVKAAACSKARIKDDRW